MQYAPTRVREKFGRFYTQILGAGHFGAYAIRPYTDAPKTCPILGANPCRRIFGGVCFCAPTRVYEKFGGFWTQTFGEDCFRAYAIRPYTDTCKIWRVSYFHTRMRQKRTRFHYPQLRVREKPARFHISAHGYTKNAPDFTHPNKDTPKTRPVLAANSCRRTFRGVCNTPLHGYMKNLAGFIFPHPDAPKNAPDFTLPNRDTPKPRPISPIPIRIHPKPAQF